MRNQSSAGSRTLLLFGFITLLSGLELCGQRLVDLYGLRPAEELPNDKLLVAGNFDRVRFAPASLRFSDALYYRSDLGTFSEHDPRESIRVNGTTDLATLVARRRELHGAHVIVENVPLASPPFNLGGNGKPDVLQGEAHVERVFAALTGSGDALYAAPPIAGDRNAAIAAFTPRTSFAGALAALAETPDYDDLVQHIRAARRVDPDQANAYMLLDGTPPAPPGSVTRLIPLGPTYNLFVAAPEGVDLSTTPAEGTIDKPIDHSVTRRSLRQMVIVVRRQTQDTKPLRIIHPGSLASFRASPNAPWVMHPGGAILLGLGVICSVLGIVWGARRDRSGTEGKLWFEAVLGIIEVAAVVVPALYFLIHRADQPPAPLMGGAPAASASIETASVASAPPVVKDQSADIASAVAAIAEIKKATTPGTLAIGAADAEAACARIPNETVCVRDRSLQEIDAAIALLAKKGDKKILCQLAARASSRLGDAKMSDESEVRDAVARLGKACL